MKEPAMIGNLPYDDNDPTLKTLRPYIKNAPAKGKINALNDLLRVALMINSIEPDLIDKLNMLIKLRDKGTLIDNEFQTIFVRSLLENINEPIKSEQNKMSHLTKSDVVSPISPSTASTQDISDYSGNVSNSIDLPNEVAFREPDTASNDIQAEAVPVLPEQLPVSTLNTVTISESDTLQKDIQHVSVESDDITLDNMMKLSGAWGEDN
ncbi:hypothetical protein [Aliivibrio fischeri]|uniref:hypothetical protein n=1 Tax=Aliivibrio fischeri TaxID=668 RepID=UPI0012D8A6EC|nr:hypothetical protein [Aliivibrio fischeri]MUJ20371.1 hypothetical protein [Aliivibrio fischeri]